MMRYKSYKSTCSYCGVGCGIVVKKDAKGKILIEGDEDHPVNKGMLCSKGRTLHHVVQDTSDRLLYPQMRWSKHAPLERVSWEDGLNRAAAVFASIIKKYGPDSVGFYVSGQCLTEEYYIVNKLVKGFLGTNNIDTNSRLCMSSAVAGYMKTFGEDSVPISYDDIEQGDCFLIAGANPAWCHPILFRRLEKRKEERPDIKVIVVDPRETATCSIADLHLKINPGTDVVLYNAIARRLLEQRTIDNTFINNHTEGFKDYKNEILFVSLKKAAKICGITVAEIKLAASYIGESSGFMTLWAMGLNQSTHGVDKNYALLNISLLTGHVGRPGSGPFSLTGQPNAMGGREVGGMATLLAAHKNLNDPKDRQEVADFWGVEKISSNPGLTATQMISALEHGKLKAIWIICTNPLVSLPDLNKVERAMEKSRFTVVQDISNKSDSLKFADLVLPAAGWLEKEGTMTNSERRISFLSKAIEAPGEALPDVEILWRFAQKMGFQGFDYNNVSEVYSEYTKLTKGTNIDVSGLNHQRLKNEGSFQWPVPFQDHPGTPRLFTDKEFYRPNGRAKFNTTRSLSHLPKPYVKDQYPMVLTTGRIRDQWHTMTKTGKVNNLKNHYPTSFAEIHPADAKTCGLRQDDVVIISNERGVVRVKAKITKTIKQGVVFLPMHWGRLLNQTFARANNLTENSCDPVSKQPGYKYSRVAIRKYEKPIQKICVIGAGAAAYRFIQTYRQYNSSDEVHVFSQELHSFYNRVLLPEYVSEHMEWEELLKLKEGELEKMNVHLHDKTRIENINKQFKLLKDEHGNTHAYDILIIATGSRPFVPKDVPMYLPGVFTMRNRSDADRLKNFIDDSRLPLEKQHLLIVGGGLLGLELAAAMKKSNIAITIIQRASRLMERQLDSVASQILAEDVTDRGITIYFDNEVDTIFDNKQNAGLVATLKSGKVIHCTMAVYTIGTIPNTELLNAAEIQCGRGATVNEYLQTSEKDIYAIGEIAEFKNRMYGITAAAEQQADIVAHYLRGDLASIYDGSILMNILKFDDFNLCSIGEIATPINDNTYEEVLFTDLNQRYYKKCLIKNDRLVGAILIGDKSEFAEFRMLIEDKIELSDKRSELLRTQSKAEPVLGKLICSCNLVGAGNLKKQIQNGCHDFTELCKLSGAGLGCGSCKPEIQDILEEQLSLVTI